MSLPTIQRLRRADAPPRSAGHVARSGGVAADLLRSAHCFGALCHRQIQAQAARHTSAAPWPTGCRHETACVGTQGKGIGCFPTETEPSANAHTSVERRDREALGQTPIREPPRPISVQLRLARLAPPRAATNVFPPPTATKGNG